MANIHSQKKRILRAERERLENRRYTSRIKTYFHRLEQVLREVGFLEPADEVRAHIELALSTGVWGAPAVTTV